MYTLFSAVILEQRLNGVRQTLTHNGFLVLTLARDLWALHLPRSQLFFKMTGFERAIALLLCHSSIFGLQHPL